MPRIVSKHHRTAGPAPTKQAISSFARVSKGLAAIQNAKDIKPTQPLSPPVPGRKRKAVATFEDKNEDPTLAATPTSLAPAAASKRQKKDNEAVPAAAAAPITPEATSRKSINTELKWPACSATSKTSTRRSTANDSLAKARQQKHHTLSKRAHAAQQIKKDALAARAKRADNKHNARTPQLPPALLELVEMHAAFVRTLVMHLAHAAGSAPIDVRALAPDVSRAWGKRNVTIEDLRRCLAIQSHGGSSEEAPLLLADYGRGKICVEKAPSLGQIDEAELCKRFSSNLMALCAECTADHVEACMEGLSIADLPQAPITSMAVPLTSNPLLARGHRALVLLKNDLASKASPQPTPAPKPSAPTAAATAPKLNLLDRLRLKQLAKCSGPAPPTGPEMERRVAIQRVPDVADVLSHLTLLKPLPRQAYPMAQIVERLRDSLRTPISSEEAARCVRILAEEVAPGWVRILNVGGREQVVVQKALQPVGRVIRKALALGA